jgi:hypothetical protein
MRRDRRRAVSRNVRVRLPNSMTPCPANSGLGTKLASVQRDQVG